MKRIVSALLMLVMLLSLAACGETTNTLEPTDDPGTEDVTTPLSERPVSLQVLQVNQYASEDDLDNFMMLCSVEWDSIVLGKESAAAFPKLDARLWEKSADNEELNYEILAEMLPEAREVAAEQEYFYGFTSASKYFVQRADDRILSIRVDEDKHTGDVHPNYRTLGINFDPATGQELALTEVLTDTEKLPAILTDKMREKYTFEHFEGLPEMLAEYAVYDFTWTLDYQGITFYFSSYEVASYLSGVLTATIWFNEMPELFAEKYTSTPEGGWAKMLPAHHEIEADLDGSDGERDTLSVSAVENEYGALELYVTRNGQEQYLDECYGFTMKPLLVCLGGAGQERYFLYIEATAENEYTNIFIYDLNSDEITLNGELSGAGFTGVWYEDVGEYGTWYEEVLNDPSEFVLSTKIRMLGTWTGSRTYTTNPEDGTIQPQTEYYELPEDVSPIVSAIDLEVTMLPRQTTDTLPAGTEFYFRRTDGETYAELELEDGRECRIEIVYKDWKPLINGVPEWDCFADLMYAD